jgi:hypothetical protein
MKFSSPERRRLAVDEKIKSRIASENAAKRKERETERRREKRPLKTDTLPARYEKGFLSKMDGRIELARELRAAYAELTDDLGGVDSLSHVKRVLAERFVWLTAILRGIELQIADGGKKESADLLAKWIQGLNSLTGLARTLGLERKAKRLDDLQSYVAKKSRRDEE